MMEENRKLINLIKKITIFTFIIIMVVIVYIFYNNKKSNRSDEAKRGVLDGKYNLNEKFASYNFQNWNEINEYIEFIKSNIKPIELQRFCSRQSQYYIPDDRKNTNVIGYYILDTMTEYAYNDFFQYIFLNTITDKDLPLSENFRKKFENELYDFFEFIVPKSDLELEVDYNSENKILEIKEQKKSNLVYGDNNDLIDWSMDTYNIYYFKCVFDSNGRLEDLVIDRIDNILDKNGEKLQQLKQIYCNNSNYSVLLIKASLGDYYWNRIYNDSDENIKYSYCFSKKFLNNYDIRYSILDKDFVIDAADSMIEDICQIDVERFIKHNDEYFDKGYLPICLNNGKIKKHYNIYFTYTDDFYLDDVQVEFLSEESIND